tara:strand:- start:1213 stop:1431 length:219 start_codon:yes stop_codon:yes gene_type:complete
MSYNRFKTPRAYVDLVSYNLANGWRDLDNITFSNWDTNLKLYGTAFNSDFFMITKITKNINGCSIQAIKADT